MGSPEELFLTALYAEEVFHGSVIRQERPRCCGREVDLFHNPMFFRDIQLGGRTFSLLEPSCPQCGGRVRAVWAVLN